MRLRTAIWSGGLRRTLAVRDNGPEACSNLLATDSTCSIVARDNGALRKITAASLEGG